MMHGHTYIKLNYILLSSGIRSNLAAHIRVNVSEEIFVSIFTADGYPKYACSRFIRILVTYLSNNYKYALHVSDALCVHHQEHYKL